MSVSMAASLTFGWFVKVKSSANLNDPPVVQSEIEERSRCLVDVTVRCTSFLDHATRLDTGWLDRSNVVWPDDL